MTRAPASFELRFDPSTLMMRSCLGWSEEALSRERSRLIARPRVSSHVADGR